MLPFTVFVSYHFESKVILSCLKYKFYCCLKNRPLNLLTMRVVWVRADCREWWWWRNVVSESVLTPRKPRLEADTAAFLRLHRKQYLGISCYADMTVSNHCRDPGHCDHQSRVITIVTRAHQQGDLILRWVAANITQVGKLSWWREGEVVCGVWEEKCLKITLTEPKDCITVQEDSYCYGCYVR